MLPDFFNETVTRSRPATKTSRGSEIPDWSKATAAQISGCCVQPSSTTLSQDGRVLGIGDSLTLYAPPSADIKAGDRITWNSDQYLVAGEPRLWRSPTGNLSNLQCPLERWCG